MTEGERLTEGLGDREIGDGGAERLKAEGGKKLNEGDQGVTTKVRKITKMVKGEADAVTICDRLFLLC